MLRLHAEAFAPGHPYTARFENPFSFRKRRESARAHRRGQRCRSARAEGIIPFDQPVGWNIIGTTPVLACDYRRKKPFSAEGRGNGFAISIDRDRVLRHQASGRALEYVCRTAAEDPMIIGMEDFDHGQDGGAVRMPGRSAFRRLVQWTVIVGVPFWSATIEVRACLGNRDRAFDLVSPNAVIAIVRADESALNGARFSIAAPSPCGSDGVRLGAARSRGCRAAWLGGVDVPFLMNNRSTMVGKELWPGLGAQAEAEALESAKDVSGLLAWPGRRARSIPPGERALRVILRRRTTGSPKRGIL